MTVGSFANSNVSKNSRTFEKVQQRLLAIEDQTFVRLNCESTFEPVGLPTDSWKPDEMEKALQRSIALATDPAKGEKITDGGIEEAAVALTAERQHVFEKAIRESTGGAEFIDDKGIAWDVKSPLSPPEGQNWQYSPDHQLEKLRHDFSQGDKVLFNLSRVNDKDRDDTLNLLKQELTCDERGLLLILTDAEVLQSA